MNLKSRTLSSDLSSQWAVLSQQTLSYSLQLTSHLQLCLRVIILASEFAATIYFPILQPEVRNEDGVQDFLNQSVDERSSRPVREDGIPGSRLDYGYGHFVHTCFVIGLSVE